MSGLLVGAGSGWCGRDATGSPASWRSTAATPRTRSRCVSWSGLTAAVGQCEESFQAGKGLAGLDEHQARRWLPLRRWTLLAMAAHALLAVLAATERADTPPAGLIALTCNEIRRLFAIFVIEPAQRSGSNASTPEIAHGHPPAGRPVGMQLRQTVNPLRTG